MERIILTDCDGVILDWLAAFEPWMLERGLSPVVKGKVEEMYALDLKYGTTAGEMKRIVHEFNSSELMRELQPYKDSQVVIPRLVDAGFRFVAVTAIGKHSAEYREENLMNLFGDVFDEVICLSQRGCKRSVLSRWKNTGLLWIEDDPDNADIGHALGLRGVIVDAAYNRKTDTPCVRVNEHTPWAEIERLIMQLYSL